MLRYSGEREVHEGGRMAHDGVVLLVLAFSTRLEAMAWNGGLARGSIHRPVGESLVRGVRCLHEDGRRNRRGHVFLHGGVLHDGVLHGDGHHGAHVRCSVLHGGVLHGDGIEGSRTTCVQSCCRFGRLGSGALGR